MSQDNALIRRTGATANEVSNRKRIQEVFKQCPIPEDELLDNLGLFINRHALSRYVYLNELYKMIVGVHGAILDFGTRWGQNLALFTNFRGMYEPFNHNRKIVGFDTFTGFPNCHEKDGAAAILKQGAYSVTAGYRGYLEQVLNYHESECPIPNIQKYELIEGDACAEIVRYLDSHPETIVALAYFDFDLYEPTKVCLDAIKDRLTKGSVVAFDELNHHVWRGETLAFKETFGLGRYAIRRMPYNPDPSYIVID